MAQQCTIKGLVEPEPVIYVCIENAIQNPATLERHSEKMKSGQRRHLLLLAAGRTPGLLQPMGP